MCVLAPTQNTTSTPKRKLSHYEYLLIFFKVEDQLECNYINSNNDATCVLLLALSHGTCRDCSSTIIFFHFFFVKRLLCHIMISQSVYPVGRKFFVLIISIIIIFILDNFGSLPLCDLLKPSQINNIRLQDSSVQDGHSYGHNE